jgi:hypothetical protein
LATLGRRLGSRPESLMAGRDIFGPRGAEGVR